LAKNTFFYLETDYQEVSYDQNLVMPVYLISVEFRSLANKMWILPFPSVL